ncbi:MAG: oxaloacetate decarboxylase subunit gamma [Psychromonas sp.]|nr:oxaloacetate decarboxylase subunit gamma [Psychromonas sp.]
MDITESLLRAAGLLALGMTFVFLFLGLLMVAVYLMAKYIPADEPVISKGTAQKKKVSAESDINPKLVAAITTAVQQYRKTEAVL